MHRKQVAPTSNNKVKRAATKRTRAAPHNSRHWAQNRTPKTKTKKNR